jgi:hypothetical protein
MQFDIMVDQSSNQVIEKYFLHFFGKNCNDFSLFLILVLTLALRLSSVKFLASAPSSRPGGWDRSGEVTGPLRPSFDISDVTSTGVQPGEQNPQEASGEEFVIEIRSYHWEALRRWRCGGGAGGAPIGATGQPPKKTSTSSIRVGPRRESWKRGSYSMGDSA